MHPATFLVAVFALVGLAVASFLNSRRPQEKKFAFLDWPGPKLVPLIGRIHDLPIEYMWLKFNEWANKFGPVYKTEMLGAKFIIISDEKVAEDLLVKRAKTYSDRPVIRSLFDSKSTHGSMEYLPLMGKNQYWSRQRRMTHAYLTEATNAHYYGVMNHEAKHWLYRLVVNPDNFGFTLEDMASRIMCQLTWDDPSFSEYHTKSAWGLLTQMSPAGPITNLLTPLWHLPLPLNPWKRAEHKRHDEQQEWWMRRLQFTRSQMQKGLARPCWMKQYLEKEKSSNLSGDYEASCVIGMLALVGVFTVAGPLYYFLIAMVYHPDWQVKVQQEVDRECGGIPDLKDMERLPILRACIKETMRWKPNVPTGVAHEAEADDEYNGYFIEKGTRILPLDWAFLRNPIKYPDPDNFRPERWLEPSWPTYQEPLTQYPTIKGMTSFGWGQRACLGQSLTQDELVVACGALAWGFDMKFKVDAKTGEKIHIPLDRSNSLLIVKPDPFEMAFEPRSEERRREIVEEWEKAEKEDRRQREAFIKVSEMRERAIEEAVNVDIKEPLVAQAPIVSVQA
ncbi:cytochrome P450 [Saccharata proteae CBS 121410]|uniref:Cytochrome P450 n=1 Tax=Saccharata proteae CBS 121410 TaxID=1314787 RepID=A0A9P4LUM9_9PEZI|nr:cytochrome P450 [Saccharata proteae CBS 121410]